MPKKEVRILVVDDEPDVLELVVFHLKKEKYKVAIADNGDKALKIAREQVPNLIILDLMLPGISGLEICQLLKQNPKTTEIPILMLTARAGEEDRVRGLELGAHDYVTKPFSPRELVLRVNNLLLLKQSDRKSIEVIEKGPFYLRIGLLPIEKAPMRNGSIIYLDKEGETEIGIVTSGGYSPTLNKPISMGRIKSEYLEGLEKVFVKIRDKILPATITKLPFIKTKYKI